MPGRQTVLFSRDQNGLEAQQNKRRFTMKNVLALSVFVLSSLGVAAAQNASLMTFKLPNAAMIGATTLPAGEYTVREITNNGNSAVLQFSDASGLKATVFGEEIPARSYINDKSEVILKSDGEHFQIDKLWLADHTYGFEIAK
jgi:hypothetical protein